ncbi:unnamed protein product [Peniophora sp. CBMAI 1063]|nr:unnamed protein product [Peniophora sp. CBMAI 1063]
MSSAQSNEALEANAGPNKPAISPAAALPSPASSPRSSNPDVLTNNGELLAALGAVLAKDVPEFAQGGDALARLGELLSNTGNLQSDVREQLASGAARGPDGALGLSADTTERVRDILASTAKGTDLAAAQQSADAIGRLAGVLTGVERLENDVRSEVNATHVPRSGPSADSDALAQGGDLLTRVGAVLAKDAPILAPGADALSRAGSALNSTANFERNVRSELNIGNVQIPPRIEVDAEHVSRVAQSAADPDALSRGGETLSRLGALAAHDAPALAPGAEVLGRLGTALSGAGKLGSDVREVVGAHGGDPFHIGDALTHLGSLLHGATHRGPEPAPRTQTSPPPAPMASLAEQSAQLDLLRNDRMPDGARAPRPTRISLPPPGHDRDLPAPPTPAYTIPGGGRRSAYSGIDIPGSDEFARVPVRALSPSGAGSSIRRQDSDSRRPTTSEGEHSAAAGAYPAAIPREQPVHDPSARVGRSREMNGRNERSARHSRVRSTSTARPRAAPVFGAGGGGDGGRDPFVEVDRHLSEKRESRHMATIHDRIIRTMEEAEAQRTAAAKKAQRLGLILNTAIGLQVVFGALTTGLGAALHGGGSSIAISILGGGSTIVATYLAKVRGSNEPELSRIRVAELSHFIREMDAFDLDHGSETGHHLDHMLEYYRTKLEYLLGQFSSESQSTGSAVAKDTQRWGGGSQQGPVASFAGSGYGAPSVPPGSYASPPIMSPHGGLPQVVQQLPAHTPAPSNYTGHNAGYFAMSSGMPTQQPSAFLQPGQAPPSGTHFTGTPPNLVHSQTAPSPAWPGTRPHSGGDVARDAGHIV